jgi:hypothetical protein
LIIQKNERLADELLDELMEEILEPERKEQHPSVTDLIRCLTQSYYNSRPDAPDFTKKTKIFFTTGLGLERALLMKRKDVPTYGVTEGIHWHTDSLDHGLVELKSTRMSVKRLEEEGLPGYWLKQIKSYLKSVGMLQVDLAVIYLIPAEFTVYRLTFEQMEIDMHWEWMKERRDEWNRAKESGQAPKAFAWNESWECTDCQYKLVCQMKERAGL